MMKRRYAIFIVCAVLFLLPLSLNAYWYWQNGGNDAFLPAVIREEPLPDLAVYFVIVTLEPPFTCYDGSPLGTQATIANIGSKDAGSFIVAINDVQAAVDNLPAGEYTSVWVSGYQFGQETAVVADVSNTIVEIDENNNSYAGWAAVPTPPPPCVTPTGPALYISGHVRLGGPNGPGVPGVEIYRSLAAYPGEVVAVTDENGTYQATPLDTQGHQELVGLWAVRAGYEFDPANYAWTYYGDGGSVTRDFIATLSLDE